MVTVISKGIQTQIKGDALGNTTTVQKGNQPYILDLVTLKRIFFQGLPLELEIAGDSNFATMASMGRNNPFYHFTGSEDVIKFNLSWFAAVEEQDDVLKKCKWLHSLTKNNGYKKRVHHVQFSFGDMFKASEFIIVSAPYSLRLFNRELGMLPRIATQEITLKRVTADNLTHADMLKLDM